MGYTFTRKPRSVWWPLVIQVPRDNGVDEQRARVHLLLPKRSELKSAEFTNERAAKYVLDWDGIIDQETNAPLPFSAENLQAMRDDAFFENALAIALARAANGAAEKNL